MLNAFLGTLAFPFKAWKALRFAYPFLNPICECCSSFLSREILQKKQLLRGHNISGEGWLTLCMPEKSNFRSGSAKTSGLGSRPLVTFYLQGSIEVAGGYWAISNICCMSHGNHIEKILVVLFFSEEGCVFGIVVSPPVTWNFDINPTLCKKKMRHRLVVINVTKLIKWQC